MTWTIITRLSCDADGCEESVSITDETTRAQHYSDLAFETREARSAAEEQAERWAESA